MLIHEALYLGLRQFRKLGIDFRDPYSADHQWRQIGLREIAIVVSVLLGALHYRPPGRLVPAHGHLFDPTSGVQDTLLPFHLVLQG